MIRKLVDYKKLDPSVISQLIGAYPYGYGDEDIIIFKNLKGEIIEAVEVKTNDTIYLVKISKSLADFISNFDDDDSRDEEQIKEIPLYENGAAIQEIMGSVED